MYVNVPFPDINIRNGTSAYRINWQKHQCFLVVINPPIHDAIVYNN